MKKKNKPMKTKVNKNASRKIEIGKKKEDKRKLGVYDVSMCLLD